jgi:hypothetical protein
MYLLFILSFLVFLWQIHRNTSYISESLNDYLIKFFFGLVSCIIPTGFLLSEINQISQAISWGIGINVLAFLFHLFFTKISENQHYSLINSFKTLPKTLSETWQKQAFLGKVIFGILGLGLLIVSILNLVIFFVTIPNEWDSMTGHLVKCALYLQNSNMNRLQGTTWTIDFYPNSLPTLQMLGYHLFGEQGFKVIHYLSYWIFAISSYGIALKISKSYSKSLFAFFLSALLPSALVQATTTETDIVLTAYLGCLIYFLFSFKNNPNKLNISLIAFMSGIWIGHKITFLLIAPAAVIVALHTVLLKKEFYRHIRLFIITFVLSIGIYALPTGYIGNVKEVGKFSLGSLSAPPMVMQWHGVEHYSTKDKIRNLALNIGRYSSDFLNFDGIRGTEWGREINTKFRYLPNRFFNNFNLEGTRFTVVSYFSFEHPLRLYKERPYWGIISFGMILPIVLLLLWKVLFRRSKVLSTEKSLIVLSIAAVLHFLSLSYSAPYDPIKGRYFLNMAVWCMPLLTLFFTGNKSKTFSIYAISTTVILSLSAICTILTIRFHPVFETKNIFNTNRLEQLTIGRPDIYEAYRNFDEIVPKDAIVALGTQQEHEDFEYPLWGVAFKRKLIPIHPFRSAVKPIPAEAQYLFYSKGVIPFQEGDIQLGRRSKTHDSVVEESEFYLRPLTPKGGLKK